MSVRHTDNISMRVAYPVFAALLAACSTGSAPEPLQKFDPVITLTGEITRADHQTYKEIPFAVPVGVTRLSVDFAYTNKENRTVIDLGLRDPQGLRGWSGGNKSTFTIGEFGATPSYRPGPLPPGEWKLILGVPNTREGQTATWTATITLDNAKETPRKQSAAIWSASQVISGTPGWYRGDFHMHTAHSDGSCDVHGKREPCPVVQTVQAARNANLDFAAITDHNTITQLGDIRSLQASFPRTLLIPGTEVTTFYGHANAIGVTGPVDFQLGSPHLPTLGKLFDELAAQNAILSVNHPSLPSGEICMGCGWTAKDTDWSRVTAIEVVNGSTLRTGGPEGPTSGIRFWDNLLKQGYRLTAIGGSDNHDATDAAGAKQPPIGKPTTVVYASELSTAGIIAGVKSGRIFVDVAGLPGLSLDMNAISNGQSTDMGGELRLPEDKSAILTVWYDSALPNAQLAYVSNGLVFTDRRSVPGPVARKDAHGEAMSARLAPGATSGYVRTELRDAAGKLLLLGNPIYIRKQ
ncbi:MAG: CehA/McbA family metallohydrolase [Hyphomonadaceae bacterium]